jgi:hypothetical protein
MPPPNRDGACGYWPAKIVLTNRATELLEHVRRLALGMQGLARFAAKDLPPEHGLDPVQFVLLGERR